MFASQSTAAPDPWPAGMNASDADGRSFRISCRTTFDGVLEIVANDHVNYLVFRTARWRAHFSRAVAPWNGRRARGEAVQPRGTGRRAPRDRWAPPTPLPSAGAARRWSKRIAISCATLVQPLARARTRGRAGDRRTRAAECSRRRIRCSTDSRSRDDPARIRVADTRELTAGVAAWIREVLWAASDHDDAPPEDLFRELTWERRHMFQSAGLFDQMPWKVV